MNRLFYFILFPVLFTVVILTGCNMIVSLFSENDSYSFLLDPQNKEVATGNSVYFRLYKIDSSGNNYINISSDAEWNSSNSTIASIHSAGYVITHMEGSVTITATYDGTSKSATLTVGAYEPGPTPTPIPGLIAEYKFDGNCMDYSGNENHGTDYNINYTTDRFGNSSQAADFNGNNAYIETPLLWNSPLSFTICAWINIDSLSGTENMIMGNCADTDNWTGFWFQFYDDYHRFVNDGDKINEISGFSENSWYHIAYAYNNNTHTLTLYADGYTVCSAAMTYTNYSTVSSNYIGAVGSGDTVNYLFSGIMDDIMIFDRELTPSEIFSLSNLRSP